MKYKKSLLVFCLIVCILFTVSSVAAGDINDTAIASEDTNDNIDKISLPAQEVAQGTTDDGLSDDALAVDENDDALNIDENNAKTIMSEDTNDNSDNISLPAQEVAWETTDDGLSDDILAVDENDDTVSIDENNAKTIISKEITNDKQVLTSPNDDKDTLADGNNNAIKITFEQTGKYVFDKKLYFKITDTETGKGIMTELIVYISHPNSDYEDIGYVNTNSNGIGVLNWKDRSDLFGNVGTFKIRTSYSTYGGDKYSLTAKVKVSKYKATIKANKMTVSKKSKKKFKINVKGQNGKPLKDVCVKVIISTGGKPITKYIYTNSKGNAYFDKVSKLGKGKHKVKISLDGDYSYFSGIYGNNVTSYITIKVPVTKKAVSIKVNKLSAKFKSGKKFKAKVIESKSKKPVSGIKVILKVDDKKAVTLKTNKKGIVSYSTKKLKVGNHKVLLKVKSTSKFKKASKKTSIKITKATKKAKTTKSKSSNSKSSNSQSSKSKIETDFKLEGYSILKYPNGGLRGVRITLNLIDANGNVLNKKITGQIRMTKDNPWTEKALGPVASGVSGSPLTIEKEYDGYQLYVRVKFAGDSNYESTSYTMDLPD